MAPVPPAYTRWLSDCMETEAGTRSMTTSRLRTARRPRNSSRQERSSEVPMAFPVLEPQGLGLQSDGDLHLLPRPAAGRELAFQHHLLPAGLGEADPDF